MKGHFEIPAGLLIGTFFWTRTGSEARKKMEEHLRTHIDSFSIQIFFTLLDTVIVSWAKINSNVGGTAEEATYKTITIFVIIKYAIVYTVILGYVIVVIGGWDRYLSLVWTLVFSASILASAISFLVLFVIMGYKTTALTNRETPSDFVKTCFQKVRNDVKL
jgi:hypothetical protein